MRSAAIVGWLAFLPLALAGCGATQEGAAGDLRLAFATSPLDGPCPETASAPAPPPALERLRLTLWKADGRVHQKGDVALGGDSVAEWKASPGKDLWLQAVGMQGGAEAFVAYAQNVDLQADRLAQVDLFFSPLQNVGCAARPLQTGRAFASAAAFPDGRVIVAGGADRRFPVPDCPDCAELLASAATDVFEPGTGSVYPAARLHRPRLLASATPLSNGNLLVVGGAGRVRLEPGSWPLRVAPEDLVASFEVYLSAENRWVEKPLPAGRVFHSASVLPDGRVLIAGGGTDLAQATAEVLVYDPGIESAGDVQAFPHPLHSARLSHRAVPISGGRVLFLGGSSRTPALAAEIFDPARSDDPFVDLNLSGPDANLFFAEAAPIPQRGDDILLAGGSLADGAGRLEAPAAQNVRIVSVSRGEAKAGPTMPDGRWLSPLLALADRRLLMAGGLAGPSAAPLADILVFDPSNDTLAALDSGAGAVSLGAARAGAAAISTSGRAVLLGGLGTTGLLASGEVIAGRPANER